MRAFTAALITVASCLALGQSLAPKWTLLHPDVTNWSGGVLQPASLADDESKLIADSYLYHPSDLELKFVGHRYSAVSPTGRYGLRRTSAFLFVSDFNSGEVLRSRTIGGEVIRNFPGFLADPTEKVVYTIIKSGGYFLVSYDFLTLEELHRAPLQSSLERWSIEFSQDGSKVVVATDSAVEVFQAQGLVKLFAEVRTLAPALPPTATFSPSGSRVSFTTSDLRTKVIDLSDGSTVGVTLPGMVAMAMITETDVLVNQGTVFSRINVVSGQFRFSVIWPTYVRVSQTLLNKALSRAYMIGSPLVRIDTSTGQIEEMSNAGCLEPKSISSVSTSGRTFASGVGHAAFDAVTGTVSLVSYPEKGLMVHADRSGQLVVESSPNHASVSVLNPTTLTPERTLSVAPGTASAIAVSPVSREVFVSVSTKELWIWEPDTAEITKLALPMVANSLDVSFDGKWLAVGGATNGICVVDLQSLSVRVLFAPSARDYFTVAIGPSQDLAVSTWRRLLVFDGMSYKPLNRNGHVRWSEDGRLFVMNSGGQISVFSPTLALVADYRIPNFGLQYDCYSLSRDGKLLVAGSSMGLTGYDIPH